MGVARSTVVGPGAPLLALAVAELISSLAAGALSAGEAGEGAREPQLGANMDTSTGNSKAEQRMLPFSAVERVFLVARELVGAARTARGYARARPGRHAATPALGQDGTRLRPRLAYPIHGHGCHDDGACHDLLYPIG